MNQDQDNEFSWTMLFLVTGFSLFLFAAILAFLNDRFAEYFVFAGALSVVAGVVAWVVDLKISPAVTKTVRKTVRRR